MSDKAGKILRNPVVKNVAMPVGNVVKKALKAPIKLVSGAIRKEGAMAKDAKYRAAPVEAPVGAYGGTNNYKSSRPMRGRPMVGSKTEVAKDISNKNEVVKKATMKPMNSMRSGRSKGRSTSDGYMRRR